MGLLILANVALLAVALPLLALGLRGRRVDDHPICRRCGFDLSGAPAGSARCAECGIDLAGRRAVRTGHRRHRRGVLLAGAVLLLAGGAPLAMVTARRLNDVDWARHKPESWLVREATDDGAADTRDAALAELLRRIEARAISGAGLAALVDQALARQADLDRPWLRTWGRVVERGRATGGVSDERWERYLAQSIGPDALTLTLDGSNDERFVYEIKANDVRLGDGSPNVLVALRVAGIADWLGLEPGWSGVRPEVFKLAAGGWSVIRHADGTVLAGLATADGSLEVRVPIRTDFFEVNGPLTREVIDAALGSTPDAEPVDGSSGPPSHHHRGARVFHVAAPWTPANREFFRVPRPVMSRAHLDREGRLRADVVFRGQRRDVTFDVFVVRGEREDRLGRVTLSAGETRCPVAGVVPGVAVGDRLRVVFRASGGFEAHGGEVVVARRTGDTTTDPE